MNYQSIFESLPFPAAVLDPEMVVRAVNRQFLDLYGLRESQVLGQHCHQVFYNRQTPCPAHRCRFADALAGEAGCANLHHYINDAGLEIFEEIHLEGLDVKDGKASWVLEIVLDITQAKALQSGLRKSNEFLNRILDSLVGVVVAADMKGRILFVNRSVERMLGYKPEELGGARAAPADSGGRVAQDAPGLG